MTGTAAVIGQEGERGSCRGEKLYTVHYAPPGETVAALIWHHGYGEHVGRMKWGAHLIPIPSLVMAVSMARVPSSINQSEPCRDCGGPLDTLGTAILHARAQARHCRGIRLTQA